MILKFADDYEVKEFEIAGIEYQVDENNVPIDIVIYSTEETLSAIADYTLVGFNMREIEEGELPFNELYLTREKGATHVCLCARLPEFTVLKASKILYR